MPAPLFFLLLLFVLCVVNNSCTELLVGAAEAGIKSLSLFLVKMTIKYW